MRVFIPLVGQFTNVGDTLHRSVLLEWLGECKEVHAYVGAAPNSFMTGLYLPKNVVIYESLGVWMFKALTSVGRAGFVYNPGEITGTKKRFLKELFLFPLLCLYRVFNGVVLKVGVDIQERGRVDSFLYGIGNYLTSYSYYRTEESYIRYGRGEVIPDLGYYRFQKIGGSRDCISLSMRSDKYEDSESLVRGVALYAKENNLKVALVSQVRMDNSSAERMRALLKQAGCEAECCLWEDRTTHAEQEMLVNEVYGRSLVVVSDRLHVLIAASNNGAVPVCISPYYSNKVNKHFKVIGYTDLVYNSADMDFIAVMRVLDQASLRRAELQQKMMHAKSRLVKVKRDMLERLGC